MSNVTNMPAATIAEEQFAKARDAINERFKTEYDLVVAGIKTLPEDVTLESVTIGTKLTIRRMKKDAGGKLTVEVDATSKIQTVKVSGTAKFDKNQFFFNFEEDPSDPD
jgi:hypothetical protein